MNKTFLGGYVTGIVAISASFLINGGIDSFWLGVIIAAITCSIIYGIGRRISVRDE